MGNSMSDLSFDDLIEDAWREFASTLALRLPHLESGQYIEVARQEGQRHRVLVAFTAAGPGKIRCTLDSALLRSSDRAEWIRTRGQLAQLGWRFLPRKDNHIAEAGHGDIPRLTQLAVSTLREVFGHAHPVFVMINDPFPPAAHSSVGELHDLTAALDALPDCVAAGYVVESEAELLTITRDVVATLLGSQVAIVDRCIELPALDVVPWRIFASPRGPSLVFTTTLSHRLLDSSLLGRLVVDHSACWPDIALTVDRDHVYAQRVVDAAVLQPQNIASALSTWRRFLADAARRLVEVLNSGGPGAHNCGYSAVPVGLQTLFDLAMRDNLSSSRIVHLANGKTDRLREYLRVCRGLAADAAESATAARERGADLGEIRLHSDATEFYRHFCALLEEAIDRATPRGA